MRLSKTPPRLLLVFPGLRLLKLTTSYSIGLYSYLLVSSFIAKLPIGVVPNEYLVSAHCSNFASAAIFSTSMIPLAGSHELCVASSCVVSLPLLDELLLCLHL